jgi:diketogulonate reductase-like aldo/keto reductase
MEGATDCKRTKVDKTSLVLTPNEAAMPIVGLGTWKADKENEVGQAVKWALAAGYRHIDCAAVYGNEKEVGVAMKETFDGGLARGDVFVTSKLWNSEHDPAHVKAALTKTLEDLQLEYLDLYLIHWPQCWEHEDGKNVAFPKTEDGALKYTETPLLDTWKALEECVEEGLVKAIGLSNYNSEQIQHILDGGKIAPAVLQVEIHPFFSQEPLVEFAKSKGLVVTAYSPLGSGVEVGGERIIDNATLKEIATKYGKSAPQLVLAWLIQRGIVVIPKSVKEDRVKQNFDVQFEISSEDMATIGALNKDVRGGYGGPLIDGKPRDIMHAHYPFRFEDLNNTAPVF